MNPKIVVGGVVAAFAIVIGVIGFAGSAIFDDVSGGNIISPSDAPREALPLEFELEDISIIEVDEKAATIEVAFKVTNPNPKAVILQLIKYELYENNMRIVISEIGARPGGLGEGAVFFTILNEKPTILKDKITIKNSGSVPEFWNALTENRPQWKVKGEAFFNLSSITAGGENEITFEFTKLS